MKKKTLEVKMIDWFDDHWYRIRYLNEQRIEVEEYFASVTTKLGILAKPHLIRWYGDVGTQEAKRKTRAAADRGTRIHWAWYTWTQGGAVIYQNPRTPAYEREEIDEIFKRFNGNVWILENQDEHFDFLKLVQMFNILKPRIVESEVKVYNVEHKEAGTGDNIFNLEEGNYQISGSKPLHLPGGNYMGDLKTGAQVSKEHYMQIAAYVFCAESMGYDIFQGALIYHTQASIRTGIEGLKVIYIPREELFQLYEDYRDISRVWERQELGKKPIIRQMPCLVVRDDKWTQLNTSLNDKEKEQPEKPSTTQSEKPKQETSKPATGASSKTSPSSSKEPENTGDTTKTPSKKGS
jgi:hypothetical protein